MRRRSGLHRDRQRYPTQLMKGFDMSTNEKQIERISRVFSQKFVNTKSQRNYVVVGFSLVEETQDVNVLYLSLDGEASETVFSLPYAAFFEQFAGFVK
jgi:hypothetical protein